MSKASVQTDTKEKILQLASGYLQHYGFNALSFQMIADELGIKKPSLYHHFASKEELGLALIQEYIDSFVAWQEKVKDQNPQIRLQRFFKIYERFAFDDSKLCPIGALSIDINSLPNSMKKSMRNLCEVQSEWLKHTLKDGIKQKYFKTSIGLQALVDLVMSTLQGALLIARVRQDQSSFTMVRKNLEALLGGKHALLADSHSHS